MSPCFCYRGLVVDVIRQLWDRSLYQDNKWLKLVHENWFSYWVDYRTCLTMQGVDRQIEELNPEPVRIAEPIYWEEEEGETPLGGPIGYTYDFVDPAPSSTGPAQGSEQRETDGK